MTDEPSTLDLVLNKQGEWTDEEVKNIIAGLRLQSEQWNANQLAGSRKIAKASSIPAKPAIKTSFLKKKP